MISLGLVSGDLNNVEMWSISEMDPRKVNCLFSIMKKSCRYNVLPKLHRKLPHCSVELR